MKVVLQIDDDKAEAMLIVLKNISFIKVKQKKKLKKDLKAIMKEMNRVKANEEQRKIVSVLSEKSATGL